MNPWCPETRRRRASHVLRANRRLEEATKGEHSRPAPMLLSPVVIRTRLIDAYGGLREFFLLKNAEISSSLFDPSLETSIRAYRDAAKRRLSAARILNTPTDAPCGIILYREAWLYLTFALLISYDEHLDPKTLTPEAAASRLDASLANGLLKGPTELKAVRAIVLSAEPLAYDRLTPEEAVRSVDALEIATRWLLQRVELRSTPQLRRVRMLRLGVAGAAVVAVLSVMTVWLSRPQNLALRKPVRSSPTAYDTTATGAVDGEKNGFFGFHSEEVDLPWLTVDLERRYLLATVKVFGRDDCCQEQSLPLAVEVSDDGKTFRTLGTRTVPFSESDPWELRPDPTVGRYIRLRTMRRSFLVLSEVEVYGRLAK